MKTLIVASDFEHNQPIPKRYTCDGEDINPPLAIEGIPEETKSLVLIVDDPDAPVGTWVHWVVWNIPVTSAIAENSVPGKEGFNSWNRNSYGGACPPDGTHRYFFKVYALDIVLDLGVNANKADVEKAMKGHIVAQGELIGLYGRK
jgi:Raf kinase inhibitor-like YbhB/YbcL family protein